MPYPDRKTLSYCCHKEIEERSFTTFKFFQCPKCKRETDQFGFEIAPSGKVKDPETKKVVDDLESYFDSMFSSNPPNYGDYGSDLKVRINGVNFED